MSDGDRLDGPVRGWVALNPGPDRRRLTTDYLAVHLTDRQREGAARNGWRVQDVVVVPVESAEAADRVLARLATPTDRSESDE